MYRCIKIFEVFWNSLSLLNIEVKGMWELINKYKEERQDSKVLWLNKIYLK